MFLLEKWIRNANIKIGQKDQVHKLKTFETSLKKEVLKNIHNVKNRKEIVLA